MPRVPLFTVALAMFGCSAYTGSTEGENGLFNFYEPNDYPDDEALSSQGFELPIALGARVDVWFTSEAATISSFDNAEVDDPSILDIESQLYPIVLRARSVGTTRLHATQTSGATDAISLSVVAADNVRIWIVEEFLGQFGNSAGLALRPGASLRIAGQPKAGSTPLLGFDVLDWMIDDTLFLDREDGGTVNTRRLEAVGASGIANISTQLGGSLEIATLAPDDPVDLVIQQIPLDGGAVTAVDSLGSQDLALFGLTGTDIAGRDVKPSPQDEDDFTATVVSGSVTIIEAKLGNRLASLRACAGTGTIELSYLGSSRTVPIEVNATDADEECP